VYSKQTNKQTDRPANPKSRETRRRGIKNQKMGVISQKIFKARKIYKNVVFMVIMQHKKFLIYKYAEIRYNSIYI
jgi:hypothetical protein